MDAMLQRHCARYIYVIPDGLRELMSDISREVLRSQPKDIYTFIADYLDALIITRENARVAARLVHSLTEIATTTAIFLEETGMSRDETDNIVDAIQKTFRRSIETEESGTLENAKSEEEQVITDILTELHVSSEKAEVAALVIQGAYRRFKQRKEREAELLSGLVDWRVAARSAIHLYRKTGVTNEEANRAATLIKAAYKGYYTRKAMRKIANQHQDFQYQPSDYLREVVAAEDIETDEDFEYYQKSSEERIKSVTIDFNTVVPHVDFDTSCVQIVTPPQATGKVSTASSVAKYSLKYIFDNALDNIITSSPIMEETPEELNKTIESYVEEYMEMETPSVEGTVEEASGIEENIEVDNVKESSSAEAAGEVK
ncbi:hypothetical protein ABEB36_008818 [Hypothenemus hampei]|uniref:RIIa domain-containing protein n=1 Tax=Hypothenemus hampei TaxID=57062 RepID=A0ABD1EQB4_HYPHA